MIVAYHCTLRTYHMQTLYAYYKHHIRRFNKHNRYGDLSSHGPRKLHPFRLRGRQIHNKMTSLNTQNLGVHK